MRQYVPCALGPQRQECVLLSHTLPVTTYKCNVMDAIEQTLLHATRALEY